jgi:GAF domain-containing protein
VGTAVRARLALGAEVALAFLAGAATFALVGVAVAAIESDVTVLVLAVVLLGVVLAVARSPGVAYAVPVAMAGVLAYDWYYLPPTHAHELPDSANLGDLLVYLALAVLIGQIATRAGHRAAVADAARGQLTEEQASLRRMATLVARGGTPPEVFAAVAREIGQVLGVDVTHIGRYEADNTVTGVASWSAAGDHMPAGTRASLEGKSVSALVLRTGGPARVDSYDDVSGPIAAALRDLGVRSSVGAPVVVDGRLWGVAVASSKEEEPLPSDTESRIGAFTELVATAISNAEARVELSRLVEEQAALRRVATLVARAPASEQLFSTVAREVASVLDVPGVIVTRYDADGTALTLGEAFGADLAGAERFLGVGIRMPPDPGSLAAQVHDTHGPARVDDFSTLRGTVGDSAAAARLGSGCAGPIMVNGALWGKMCVFSQVGTVLPAGTENRLRDFIELVATAIANYEARADLAASEARARDLAEEQAALRRVATLVAREAPQAEVFTAIAQEIALLLGPEDIRMVRYEDDHTAVVVASSGVNADDLFPVGFRTPLGADPAASRVFQTGQPVRIDDYATASRTSTEAVRSTGIRGVVATPISVEGRLWGAMRAGTTQLEPLPPDTESRLGQFTDLMATAIANTESRAEVERLAEEQAALRRVATLVAQGVRAVEIFTAVSEEVGRLFGSKLAAVARFDADGPANVVVGVVEGIEGVTIGTRFPLDDSMASARVYRTGRSSRVDAVDWSAVSGPIAAIGRRLGVASSVSSPIVVEGRLWGSVNIAATEALPAGTEERVEKFTDLVATAIANAEARAEVERLAEEQAALRRVATLVADGAAPIAVFDAVTVEMERLLDADGVALNRYEPGGELTVLAHRGRDPFPAPPGTRLHHEELSVSGIVRRTERPARQESYDRLVGAIPALAQTLGIRSSVGAPVVVDGRQWGVMVAHWRGEQSPPPDTEERMGQFAELLDTAIANADSRDQLTASRTRLLTEADEARRRVVRDLHDGAQQRLVHAIVTLKLAQRAFREGGGKVESLIDEALEQAERGNAELRELAHGILPSALTHGGLRAGIDAVVKRLDLPVQLSVRPERFPAEVEASAYFIVVEALTNVVKHSGAGHAEVRVSVEDGILRVEVRDDGVGGADPTGHGLLGIGDRATALGGRLEIESPAGGGTLVTATLPLSSG